MLSRVVPTLRTASSVSRLASPSSRRLASGHHGPSYNPPTGRLFGEKPVPPGQKRVKQDWETIYYLGMFGGMALAAVLLMYKPDTTVQSWAMVEAKKNLDASGEAWQYKPADSQQQQ